MRTILNEINETPPLTRFSNTEKRFQSEIADFGAEYVSPRVVEMDNQSELDRFLIAKLFEHNFMNIEIPTEFGGRNGSFFEAILAIEELAKIDPAVAVFVDVQNTLVNNAVLRWGKKEQKEDWLTALAKIDVGAFSITEKQAGSDAYALTTTAEKTSAGYVLNGEKQMVTNAAEANRFIVFAYVTEADSDQNALTAFLIPSRDTRGLSISPSEEKLGIKASSTCKLFLNDVLLPENSVLGDVGLGKQIALETLTDGRIGIAAQMLGLCGGALQAGMDYAKQRQQFGTGICNFQSVHFSIAEMATQVEAARLMVYNAARLKSCSQNQGEYFTAASMAKYLAAETAGVVTSRVMDLFGGAGFFKNSPAEKFYRDAKIGTIYEGTANMQLRSIAKMILNLKHD